MALSLSFQLLWPESSSHAWLLSLSHTTHSDLLIPPSLYTQNLAACPQPNYYHLMKVTDFSSLGHCLHPAPVVYFPRISQSYPVKWKVWSVHILTPNSLSKSQVLQSLCVSPTLTSLAWSTSFPHSLCATHTIFLNLFRIFSRFSVPRKFPLKCLHCSLPQLFEVFAQTSQWGHLVHIIL